MPTPYLFFDGRCEEAIELYKKALGAKVEMMAAARPDRAWQRQQDHAFMS